MPIAIPAAIVGASAIGAVASSSAASKASKTAANTAAANNALQSQIYDKNAAALAPYEATGAKANTAVENLLGLGGTAGTAASGASPANQVQWAAANSGPQTRAAIAAYQAANPNATPDQQLAAIQPLLGPKDSAALSGYVSANPYQPATAGTSGAQAQQDAFNAFRQSDGYQFRLAQGQRSVQAALAGKGYLDSGAAQKAILNYGQGAASSEFNNYLSSLTDQQRVGLTAASAQAGVGQNYANAVSANNNSAASTTANAALSGASQINSAIGSGLQALTFSQGLNSSYGNGSFNTGSGINSPGSVAFLNGYT